MMMMMMMIIMIIKMIYLLIFDILELKLDFILFVIKSFFIKHKKKNIKKINRKNTIII